MKVRTRVLGLGTALLAGAVCFFASVDSGNAAADDKAEEKKIQEIRDLITKAAEALEKGNDTDAKKLTDELAKKELLPVMKQLKLRNKEEPFKGGMGLGQPGTIIPDGIEAKLIAMFRKPMTKGELDKQQADLIRAAVIMNAISSASKDKSPVKVKKDKMDPKNWAKFNDDMAKYSKDLVDALKGKDPEKAHAASKGLYGSCTACHSEFRDVAP